MIKNNDSSFILLLFIVIFILAPGLYAQEQDLEKLLDLNLEELMHVKVVTASKKAQTLSEVPATVRIITAEEIKERGYFTLEEALSDLPGIQFRNIVGFNSYVFLRGAPSQNNLILVLVDGIQINELNSGGFYGGGQFNLSNVKRIEVVYGPASALYGTNAISGIINIITNDPEDIQGGQASVQLGAFDTRNIDFRYGHYSQKQDFGFILSGMLKQTDKADLRGGKGDNNWTNNMENFEDDLAFDGKVTYKNLSFGLVFQDKQASRTTNYKTTGTNYLDSGTNLHIRFINSHLKYLYNKNPKWSSLSQLYYRNATVMDNTISSIQADTVGQTGYYRPNALIGFENQHNFLPAKNINIIIGFVLEAERLAEGFSKSFSGSPEIKPPTPEKPEMTTNHLKSLYLQTQIKFFKYTEITFGIRRDDSSVYGTLHTPRFGLVFNRQKLTSKLLYMQAFRAPKPWDYTYGEGNNHLKSEKMRSWELTMTYAFSSNFRADLSLYKNTVERLLTLEGNRWINGTDLKTDGFETSLEYAKGKIKSYVNYTYNFSRFGTNDRVPEIGRTTFNVGLIYAFTNHLKLNIRGNYLGRRKNVKTINATGSNYIAGAFILHSNFSILDFKNFDFHITAKNLLNTEYYHTSNRPPERYRQPQRTVLFKAGYNF